MKTQTIIYFGVGHAASDGKETGSDGKECQCDNCYMPTQSQASEARRFNF